MAKSHFFLRDAISICSYWESRQTAGARKRGSTSSLVLKGQYLTRRRRLRRVSKKGCQARCRVTKREIVCESNHNILAKRDTCFSNRATRLYYTFRLTREYLLPQKIGRWETLRGDFFARERDITDLRVGSRTRRIPGGQKHNCSPSRSRANLFDMPTNPDCECDFPGKQITD